MPAEVDHPKVSRRKSRRKIDRRTSADEDLESDAGSQQQSELEETDSSNAEDQDALVASCADMEDEEVKDGEEARDTDDKNQQMEDGKQAKPAPIRDSERHPNGRQEMGGVVVYDSHAELTGNEKIIKYFEENPPVKMDPYIIFGKEELQEIKAEFFAERARERDFASDQDKHLFKNLTRFQPQRDFSRLQYDVNVPNLQNVLIFDSRFENGNLRKVAKVNNIEYNLWLENDLNTKGHTQWYYFKVVYRDIPLAPEKKTHKIKFNILNLAKTTSLYQEGMKPCIWSKRKYEADGTGWFRGGEDITYAQNDIPRYSDSSQTGEGAAIVGSMHNNAYLYNNNGAGEGVETYFTFSFKYEFEPNQNDEVWFAHAIPSTFTQMQEGLATLKEAEEYKPYFKTNLLCLSLARNPVPLLTITENVDTYLDYYEELRLRDHLPSILRKAYRQKYANARRLAKQGEQANGQVQRLLEAAVVEDLKQFWEQHEEQFLQTSPHFAGFNQRLLQFLKDHSQKKCIFLTSRVHPGEPQASHMLDGLLKYLLSPEAAELRRHFVIRIVPMLNPDGVIYGNYRCSLLGCDLNRKWDKPNRLLHPTIFYSKQLIRYMHQERRVALYCDLHGHSRKQNAFFYGCSYKNFELDGRLKNAQLRIVPLMCCQKNSLFSLKDCRFRIEKCKESTARVVIFREYNIMNSFTLECSFHGKELQLDERDPAPTKSSAAQSVYGLNQPPKKPKVQHMSLPEYNSLGETLIQVMHNYLPKEQYKLQFLSGKILDVFHDEFVKFVPSYILKREEERRKKMEEEAGAAAVKAAAKVSAPQNRQTVTEQGATALGPVGRRARHPIKPIGQQLRTEKAASQKQALSRAQPDLGATDEALTDDGLDGRPRSLSGGEGDLLPSFMDPMECPEEMQREIDDLDNFMQGIQSRLQAGQSGFDRGSAYRSAGGSSDGTSDEEAYKPPKRKKKIKKKAQQPQSGPSKTVVPRVADKANLVTKKKQEGQPDQGKSRSYATSQAKAMGRTPRGKHEQLVAGLHIGAPALGNKKAQQFQLLKNDPQVTSQRQLEVSNIQALLSRHGASLPLDTQTQAALLQEISQTLNAHRRDDPYNQTEATALLNKSRGGRGAHAQSLPEGAYIGADDRAIFAGSYHAPVKNNIEMYQRRLYAHLAPREAFDGVTGVYERVLAGRNQVGAPQATAVSGSTSRGPITPSQESRMKGKASHNQITQDLPSAAAMFPQISDSRNGQHLGNFNSTSVAKELQSSQIQEISPGLAQVGQRQSLKNSQRNSRLNRSPSYQFLLDTEFAGLTQDGRNDANFGTQYDPVYEHSLLQNLDKADLSESQSVPHALKKTSSPELKSHSWTIKKNAGTAKSTEVSGVKTKARTAEKIKGSLNASIDFEVSDRQAQFDCVSPPTYKKGSVQHQRVLNQRAYERRSECRLTADLNPNLNQIVSDHVTVQQHKQHFVQPLPPSRSSPTHNNTSLHQYRSQHDMFRESTEAPQKKLMQLTMKPQYPHLQEHYGSGTNQSNYYTQSYQNRANIQIQEMAKNTHLRIVPGQGSVAQRAHFAATKQLQQLHQPVQLEGRSLAQFESHGPTLNIKYSQVSFAQQAQDQNFEAEQQHESGQGIVASEASRRNSTNDMLSKQKQLQIQLERQQRLLQQLQLQLQNQQELQAQQHDAETARQKHREHQEFLRMQAKHNLHRTEFRTPNKQKRPSGQQLVSEERKVVQSVGSTPLKQPYRVEQNAALSTSLQEMPQYAQNGRSSKQMVLPSPLKAKQQVTSSNFAQYQSTTAFAGVPLANYVQNINVFIAGQDSAGNYISVPRQDLLLPSIISANPYMNIQSNDMPSQQQQNLTTKPAKVKSKLINKQKSSNF